MNSHSANSAGEHRRPDDIALLFRGEFGTPVELAVRFVVIVLSGLGLYAYLGWWIGPIWSAIYLLTQALAYFVMSHRGQRFASAQWPLALSAYMMTTSVFVTLPAFLITTDDPVLVFCAVMALVALCVFTLWRETPPGSLLYFDIGIGWFTGALAMVHALPFADGAMAVLVMCLTCGAAVGYYSMAMITTRAARQTLKEAAQRSAEAQKMEAVGRLAGGISHDFNNLLTVLQGNLELYQEIPDPEERHMLVVEAHAAAIRASGLVSQLLSFSRRAPLTPDDAQVEDVLAELASMSSRLLPATITVETGPPAVRMMVRADLNRLNAALLNLVINARDAMEGHGTLRLSAHAVDRARDPNLPPELSGRAFVRFDVADSGPGMSDDLIAKAVEPFFTTKPVGAGSGLGLPSAKGFAEQSGGALLVRSAPGDTVVSIYLPLTGSGAP